MAVSRRSFGALLGAFLSSSRKVWPQTPDPQVRTGRPPNFVILLCDDLGYGDLGCYGHRTIRTPNIDRMALEGTRLTEFYATPTCTPSRAALLTGRYPVRSGLTRVLIPREQFGMPDSEITLPEALGERGYRTSCIGKWHLGDRRRHLPTRHGFERFYGLLYSNDMTLPVVHWPPIKLFRDEKPVESPVKQSMLTQRFTSEALRFFEASKDEPFLLYLAYTMPHLPWSASEQFAGKSNYGRYGDAVEEIDASVGELLKGLKRLGLDENTLVVFCSDNGPELVTPGPGGSTGGLRGGKGSTWEGGVRVPCVVRWPGRVPAGRVERGISSLMDLFTTCVGLAGAQLPHDHVLDGLDLAPFLEGKSASPRSYICHYRGRQLFAIRLGEWKLHFRKVVQGRRGRIKDTVPCEPLELYNLEADPEEARQVAGGHSDIVARLTDLAGEHQKYVAAGRPAPPPWRSLLPRGRRFQDPSRGKIKR
jgi:arylsulfatase A-like enzyme